MEALSPLADLAIPGTAIGAGVWLFYRLVLHADRRESALFRELRKQRDEWRERAEIAEDALAECHHSLARARVEPGYRGGPDRRRRHRDQGRDGNDG